MVKVISLMGFARFNDEGEIRGDSPRTPAARSSTFNASRDKGTRCSAFAFILPAGIVHVFVSQLISGQVAFLASPGRTAVKIKNRRHNFVDKDAPESSIISKAFETSV